MEEGSVNQPDSSVSAESNIDFGTQPKQDTGSCEGPTSSKAAGAHGDGPDHAVVNGDILDKKYKQWKEAGAALRKTLAHMSGDGPLELPACARRCRKEGLAVSQKLSSGDATADSSNISRSKHPTPKGSKESPIAQTDVQTKAVQESSVNNEVVNAVQDLKLLKDRVQEISAKYKLNVHNNETVTCRSRKKLHTHAELIRNRLSVDLESSSESDADGENNLGRHSSPKVHKGKKQKDADTSSPPAESGGLDSTKPKTEETKNDKGKSTNSSKVLSFDAGKTPAEVKRQLFSEDSRKQPKEKDDKNPILAEFMHKDGSMLHAPLLLAETDSVLNLADISSTSGNEGDDMDKHISSPEESSTVTNTPLCTPAKENPDLIIGSGQVNNSSHESEEHLVSDTDLLADEMPDLVIENFSDDSTAEANSKSITLSQEEIDSLPDIQSDQGSSSADASEEDIDADDEFECDCPLCQQKATDTHAGGNNWLLEEEGLDSQGSGDRVVYHPEAATDQDTATSAPYSLDVDALTPLDVLISRNSSDVLELMFQNVIMQMLAVYPELLTDQAAPPASQTDLDALKKISITPQNMTEDLQCPICLCQFEDKEEAMEMPCQHLFHSLCLKAWLKKSATCPVCRRRLGKN